MEETIDEQTPEVIETPVVKKKEPNSLRFVSGVLVAFAIIFIFGIFFGRIVFFPIEVQGVSMQPTLNKSAAQEDEHGDIVYLGSDRKISYGDIVVFDSGLKVNGKSQNYIKRVIALPGDTVEFKVANVENNFIYYDLYINGIKKVEDNIKDQMRIYEFTQSDEEMAFLQTFLNRPNRLTLGENEFFLMGDNRNNSLDSRHLGPINKSRFLGKVYLHIPQGQSIFEAIFDKIF